MATASEMLKELQDSVTDIGDLPAYGKFMFYGNSGVGKTVEAVTLAQMITPVDKEILIIDSTEGWVSLKNHPELMKRVRRMPYRDMKKLELLSQAIEAKAPGFDNIGCLILDEFSTMARHDVDFVLTARSLQESKKDPDTATQTDMGISTRRMDRGTARLLNITKYGLHLFLLAHVRADKDKLNIEVESPAFMPAFNGIVRESMHIVAKMTADEIQNSEGKAVYQRLLQVHPTRQVIAKSRVGGLSVRNDLNHFNKTVAKWIETGAPEEAANETFVGIEVN